MLQNTLQIQPTEKKGVQLPPIRHLLPNPSEEQDQEVTYNPRRRHSLPPHLALKEGKYRIKSV
jgi:hypothetical protein